MAIQTLPQFLNGAKPARAPARPAGGGRPSKLSKAVSEALRYFGTVRNYAPTTLDNYQDSFDRFQRFLSDHGRPDELQQFTGSNVLRFVEWLAAKNQKPSTIVIRLTALSSIATALMNLRDTRDRPLLTQNPTKTFAWPTVDRPETKFLLPGELAAFLGVARPLRESIARDLLMDTGLRCSELCRANVGDVITIDGKTSLALTVKGRGLRVRKRHVPLSEPVASALVGYLLERGIADPQDPTHRDEPMLVNRDGGRWRRTSLSTLMARIGQEAGIARLRVSAHKLRHTANVVARFARRADGTALDRWTRSQLLTHENPQSLDRYEHLLPDELFEAREAQRLALNRYLGGSDTKAVAPPQPEPPSAMAVPRDTNGDRTGRYREMIQALVQALARGAVNANWTPEQLLALLDPAERAGDKLQELRQPRESTSAGSQEKEGGDE